MADNLNKIEGVGKVSMDVFLRAGLNTVGNFAQRIQQAIDVLYLKKKDPSLIIILERSCSSVFQNHSTSEKCRSISLRSK